MHLFVDLQTWFSLGRWLLQNWPAYQVARPSTSLLVVIRSRFRWFGCYIWFTYSGMSCFAASSSYFIFASASFNAETEFPNTFYNVRFTYIWNMVKLPFYSFSFESTSDISIWICRCWKWAPNTIEPTHMCTGIFWEHHDFRVSQRVDHITSFEIDHGV